MYVLVHGSNRLQTDGYRRYSYEYEQPPTAHTVSCLLDDSYVKKQQVQVKMHEQGQENVFVYYQFIYERE